MIDTVNSRRLTLFDALDSQQQGQNSLDAIVNRAKQRPGDAAREVEFSLTQLGQADALVNKIAAGDANVSQKTVDDMLMFYTQQIDREIQSKAKDYGVIDLPPVVKGEQGWQLVTADEPDKAQQRLLDYINRDKRMSQGLDKVLALSDVNEKALSQSFAGQLQQADVPDSSIENYLVNTRQQLANTRVFGLVGGQLALGTPGLAEQGFAALNPDKAS